MLSMDDIQMILEVLAMMLEGENVIATGIYCVIYMGCEGPRETSHGLNVPHTESCFGALMLTKTGTVAV